MNHLSEQIISMITQSNELYNNWSYHSLKSKKLIYAVLQIDTEQTRIQFN